MENQDSSSANVEQVPDENPDVQTTDVVATTGEITVVDSPTTGEITHHRHACGHVDMGTCPHQVLAATLTLSWVNIG